MAKLPICAPWFPPAAVAAAPWHSARPISRVSHVPPQGLCGCSSSPAPIWIQVGERDAFRFRCQKGADHQPWPEPAERDDNDTDAAARTEIPFVDLIPANSDNPIIQELRKFHVALAAAAGMREVPDMFCKEKDGISNYMIKIASSCAKVQNAKNKVMAIIVCAEALKALDLASMVMDLTDIASLDLGTTEFSQDTSNQMVRSYASTICDVAKDAYQKGIKIDNISSFLDALRGLGVVCRILVQDTVAMLKDSPLKNSISSGMQTESCEFDKKLNNLKQEFMVATENKHMVVMDIVIDGMKCAQSYTFQLIRHRRDAICELLHDKTCLMESTM